MVNGETIVSDYSSTTAVSNTIDVLSGDVVTVVARYTSIQAYSSYAYVSFKSTGAFKITTTSNSVMSRYVTGYQEGTGSILVFEYSEMRAHLNDTVMQLIPEPVRSRIKAVTKTHTAYDASGKSYTQTTTEKLWIPDYNEMFSSSRPYKALFPDNASRVKHYVGATSASWWWLRSAYYSHYFYDVSSSGNRSGYAANNSGGVAVGFCT